MSDFKKRVERHHKHLSLEKRCGQILAAAAIVGTSLLAIENTYGIVDFLKPITKIFKPYEDIQTPILQDDKYLETPSNNYGN